MKNIVQKLQDYCACYFGSVVIKLQTGAKKKMGENIDIK